jgi:uncharacterized membrane protein YgcG
MEKAGAYFGAAPRMASGVSDSAGVLKSSEFRCLRRRIAAFARRFPQAGFTVAFMALPPGTPGATYAWWVFNRCNPAGELHKGSANRHLFLLVDAASHGAWLTPGYGLEPFITTGQLTECLEKAKPFFERGQYLAAVTMVLAEAETLFRHVIAALPRVFGIERVETVRQEKSAEGAAAW